MKCYLKHPHSESSVFKCVRLNAEPFCQGNQDKKHTGIDLYYGQKEACTLDDVLSKSDYAFFFFLQAKEI